MACEKRDRNLKCDLEQFERNNYFYGKLMTVRDFEAEQHYFDGKRHLINRLIHGIGIVCGLEVEDSGNKKPTKDEDVNWSVYLNSGVALDCCGQEIVVSQRGQYKVNGKFDEDKSNVLYLKYAECEKDTVLGLSNLSNCEEECCPARIGEIFTLEWGTLPEVKEITGTVKSGGSAIPGASVEVLRDKVVVASAVTDNKGKYNIIAKLPAEKAKTPYVLRFLASGHDVVEKEVPFNDLSKSKTVTIEKTHKLEDPAELKKNIAQKYYEEYLTTCPECDDAKVLLGVFKEDGESLKMDKDATYEYRSIVYNNPMLYDLLSTHITDFNNPHQVNALQTGALVSINGVPGTEDEGDVQLLEGDNVTITPDEDQHKITISSEAGVDQAILDQLQTVFQYIRERALKCVVTSLKLILKEFSVPGTSTTLINNIKKYVDEKKYLTESDFLATVKGLFLFKIKNEQLILENITIDNLKDEFSENNISLEGHTISPFNAKAQARTISLVQNIKYYIIQIGNTLNVLGVPPLTHVEDIGLLYFEIIFYMAFRSLATPDSINGLANSLIDLINEVENGDHLKVATAVDEVCFYQSLLEKETATPPLTHRNIARASFELNRYFLPPEEVKMVDENLDKMVDTLVEKPDESVKPREISGSINETQKLVNEVASSMIKIGILSGSATKGYTLDERLKRDINR